MRFAQTNKRRLLNLVVDLSVVTVVAHAVFWWGNRTLLMSLSDFRYWTALNSIRKDSSFLRFESLFVPLQGLGTRDVPSVQVLDLPIFVSSRFGDLVSETLIGGISVLVIFLGFRFLASTFELPEFVVRASAYLGAFLYFLPSPVMFGRLTISMDSMPQTLFLFCLTAGLFNSLSAQLRESQPFFFLTGATGVAVFALCLVGFINQPMFALGLSSYVIYAVLNSRRGGGSSFSRDHIIGFGFPIASLAILMFSCVWLIVRSASGSQSELIVYRSETTFRFWFFDDLADPIVFLPHVLCALVVASSLYLTFSSSTEPKPKSLGVFGLLQLIAILVFGNLYNFLVFRDLEVLPRPSYVALFFYPVFLISIVYAGWLFARTTSFGKGMFGQRWILASVSLPTLMIVWSLVWFADNKDLRDRQPGLPPPSSNLVTRVSNDMELATTDRFRGRVMLVQSSDATGEQVAPGIAPNGTLDNLHAFLLYEKVPTLSVYSLLQDLKFVEFYSEFFSGRKPFARNWLIASEVNTDIARLAGVRSIVLSGDVLDHDGGLEVRKTLSDDSLGSRLDLYVIPDANVGDFSPTREVIVGSTKEAFRLMGDSEFDPQKTFFSERPLGGLVPATMSEVRVSGSKIRVRAASSGTSLLVLPFQFSECARVVKQDGHASIHRVNGIFMGLRFAGSIDVEIDNDARALFPTCIK